VNRHQAFVFSDTSGYLHWWCAQDNPGNTTGSDAILVRLDGDTFEVSRSVRIDAISPAENLKVTAFENTNGTLAIPVINEAHFERQVEVSIGGCQLALGVATAYLADNEHNNTLVGTYGVNGSTFLASIPPRSMTTFFLE
jgi:glucosylceramidase